MQFESFKTSRRKATSLSALLFSRKRFELILCVFGDKEIQFFK